MKIIILHQDLFFQGGQYVAAKVASGLAAAGHEVVVVVSKVHDDIQRNHPKVKPFLLHPAVRLIILPSRRALGNILPLARLIRRMKPDVIMPHVGHYFWATTMAKMLALSRLPIVYVEHNADTSVPLKKGWKNRLRLWVLCRAARVITVSDAIRDYYVSQGGLSSQRVVRIYNPVIDTAFYERLRCTDEISSIVSDGKIRGKVVVAAGAMSGKRKGFDLLIRSFAQVVKELPETRLVIFGQGPDKGKLETLVQYLKLSDKVFFPGFTAELPVNLAVADLFVHAARCEPFGLVLVEALASGCPVVSTDCPVGPREILRDGALGQLVPVDDVDALAGAMISVLRGEWKPTQAFDSSEYTDETSLRQYKQVLNEVANRRVVNWFNSSDEHL